MFSRLNIVKICLIWLMAGSTAIVADTLRIMPMGDSITYGDRIDDTRPTGDRHAYRNYLWYDLKDANFNNGDIDFVGSQEAGDDVEPPFDTDNEGHPGIRSTQLEDDTYAYMSMSDPDIVLLHIGTNDHRSSFAHLDEGVVRILDEIDRYSRDRGKPIRVYIALIIDRQYHDQIIEDFNNNLREVVQERINNGANLVLVDMYNGAGMNSSDYADETHPNDRGYQKMATVWANALTTTYQPPKPPEPPTPPEDSPALKELKAFPTTLVDASYIVEGSINIGPDEDYVSFETEVPENGIIF